MVYIAAADIDDGLSFEEAIKLSRGLECHIYTTYKHSADSSRLRIVYPLARPVPAAEWPQMWDRFNEMHGNRIDSATRNVSRIFFLPCRHEGDVDSRSEPFHGPLLDLYALPEAKTIDVSSKPREARGEAHRALNVDDEVNDVDIEKIDRVFKSIWDKRIKAGGSEDKVNGSDADYSVLRSLTKKGVSFSAIFKGFEKDSHPGHYRKMMTQGKHVQARRYLEHSYIKALAEPDTPEFIESLCETRILTSKLHQAAENIDFDSKRAAKTLLKVLQAHITTFSKTGKDSWNLSVREVKEIASINSITTVSKAHYNLKNTFKVLNCSGPRNEKRYSFTREFLELVNSIELEEQNETLEDHTNTSRENSSDVLVCAFNVSNTDFVVGQTQTSGVFEHTRRGGLGDSAERVYVALMKYGPLTLDELSEKTKLLRATVRRSVSGVCNRKTGELKTPGLEFYGIVTEIGGVVTVNPDFDFKSLAIDLGVDGIKEIRAKKHRDERLIHRQNFKNFKEMRRREKLLGNTTMPYNTELIPDSIERILYNTEQIPDSTERMPYNTEQFSDFTEHIPYNIEQIPDFIEHSR